MHPQLELLLQIQDLNAQRRELLEAEASRQMEEEEFHVDVAAATHALDEKIAEIEQELSPTIRGRFERIAKGRGRAVAPVIGGTCYGCFTSVPTAAAGSSQRNDDLLHCESCGRFLYILG